MSAHNYYNNNPDDSHQNYQQAQYRQGHEGYQPTYSHDQPYQSHTPSGYNQTNEPMNWGYGTGTDQNQQPSYGNYDQQTSAAHHAQQYSSYEYSQEQSQNQGYGQSHQNYAQQHDQYQNYNTYGDNSHYQAPNYSSNTTDYNRQASPNPHQANQYPSHAYGAPDAGHQPYPGGPAPAEGERGLLGAIGGAAAGGFAGHKVNHGFLGAVGGAYAGHKLEDKIKDKKKKDKKDKYGHDQSHGRRRGSSSSSSSSSDSSDDEKKKYKKYGAGGAAAYGHHKNRDQGHSQGSAGNFSASSSQISLDRDHDLIASCATLDHGHKLSSISLNDYLTNSGGHLQWARGGGFGATSKNVRLVNGGKVLEAECGDGRGGWHVSRIRLDERITNNNGDLQYLG